MSSLSRAGLAHMGRDVAAGLLGCLMLIAAPTLVELVGGGSGYFSAISGGLLITLLPLCIFVIARRFRSRHRGEDIQRNTGPAIILDAHVDSLLLDSLGRAWPDLRRLNSNEALGKVAHLVFTTGGVSLWGGEPVRLLHRVPWEDLLSIGPGVSELNGRTQDALKMSVRVQGENQTLSFVVSASGSSGIWKLSDDRISRVSAAVRDLRAGVAR